MSEYILRFDGSCKGPQTERRIGMGLVIYRDDNVVFEKAWTQDDDNLTNNVAEYRGLLGALAYLVENGYQEALIRSDSQLLVRQMQGRYKVRHPRLQPLYRQAKALEANLALVTFEHVRRTENTAADRLSNLAMDAQESTNKD